MGWKIWSLLVCVGAGVGFLVFANLFSFSIKTEYHPHKSEHKLTLVDDLLSDINPQFDPDLIERRLLDGWEVNSSAAILRLDCPDMRVDRYVVLDRLFASYSQSLEAAEQHYWKVLPSANLIDGAAKQFDDGLYATLELAMFSGELGVTPSPRVLMKSIHEELDEKSQARAFIAAGFSIIGEEVQLDGSLQKKKANWLAQFNGNESLSKPISFYNWNDDLKKVWRFTRYFQQELSDLNMAREMATVIKGDARLAENYQKYNAFFGRLTNPQACLSLDQLDNGSDLNALATKHGVRNAVAVFPASTSRETELFDRLFSSGLPQGTNLMVALIERVLSGEVDLQPGENSGWYDQQIYALETMLMPARGEENDKLLFTARYKKRLLEAFKAMMTKRRETHARALDKSSVGSMARPKTMKPRLRIEPCATYYLRTARAYAFLAGFLESVTGEQQLNNLNGLRRDGEREMPLGDELIDIRNRFYGMYLISCDDIGMKPSFANDEPVDQKACYQQALAWLERIETDLDLKADTRVSVPILYDIPRNKSHLWATLGVRLAHLKVRYEVLPRIREPGNEAWTEFEAGMVERVNYLIAVDEFAEIRRNGSSSLTRNEFRAICDQHETKADIVDALSN